MDKAAKFKVASWNMHKGTDCWGRLADVDDSLEALRRQDWDLCFLQEAPGVALARFAKEHGLEMVYGFTRATAGSHYGNAILARKGRAHLMGNQIISAHRVEFRRALFARVELPDHRVIIAGSTHFGLTQRWRLGQALRLAEHVATLAESIGEGLGGVVIGGDFNDRSLGVSRVMGSHGFVDGTAGGARAKRLLSYPAQFPLLPLDAIYSKGLDPVGREILGGRQGWRSYSDHLPIAVDLLRE